MTSAWGGDNVVDNQSSLKVTVKPLSKLVISAKYSSPATVVSLNHAQLSAEITGRITKLPVRVGDQVKKGELLVVVDCRDYRLTKKQAQAALKSSKAQYELAKKQYKRNLHLRESRTIPQTLLDESIMQQAIAKADIDAKKPLLEMAEIAIERCRVKAPFSGQITFRQVSQGQLLTPGSPILKLLQNSALEIKSELTPQEVQSISQGNSLIFKTMNEHLPIRIRAVIQEVKEDSNVQEIRLELNNDKDDPLLSVGHSGRLLWNDQRQLLPSDYVVRRKNSLGVMIAVDNKAVFHHLPEAQEGHPAVIDLPASTHIIQLNRFVAKDSQVIDIKAIDARATHADKAL